MLPPTIPLEMAVPNPADPTLARVELVGAPVEVNLTELLDVYPMYQPSTLQPGTEVGLQEERGWGTQDRKVQEQEWVEEEV